MSYGFLLKNLSLINPKSGDNLHGRLPYLVCGSINFALVVTKSEKFLIPLTRFIIIIKPFNRTVSRKSFFFLGVLSIVAMTMLPPHAISGEGRNETGRFDYLVLVNRLKWKLYKCKISSVTSLLLGFKVFLALLT